MADNKGQIYFWEGLTWDIGYDMLNTPYALPLCPKQKCHCKLIKSNESYPKGEYKYRCISCDFKITLNKPIEEKGKDFLEIVETFKYKDAEIINLDGELISVQRKGKKDNDYWIDAKISKNKKGELLLMVLAGSRKSNEKVQLFLDPTNERLAFDQNNDHPTKIFSKVIAIFKNSNVTIDEDKH